MRTSTRKGALLIILALPILGAGAVPEAESPDDPDTLANLAVKANPAIQSIENQISALRHKADAAVMWSDPVFSVEYSNVPWDSWALDQSPMSGIQFKVQQKLTLPGKNDRRAEEVQGESEVKRWELGEKENQLKAQVKRTYWSLALVRQLRILNERHVKLVDQLLATVRVKYQVGKVGQHDLLSLEVLKKKIEDDLGDFDQNERELVAALNAALHRDGSAPVRTPHELPVVDTTAETADLLELAGKHRPLLKETRARSEWHRLSAAKAGYERWPDITVWAGYRIRESAGADPGTDFFSVGLSVPLPFDYSGQAESTQEQHQALASAADDSYRAAMDGIRATLESSLAAWQRAAQKATSYQQDIIPAADRTLQSTLAAYQSDRADFASLYQSEVRLLQFERAASVARATTQIERSVVEASIGTEISVQER